MISRYILHWHLWMIIWVDIKDIYFDPGAGAKFKMACDTSCPGNGAVWTAPRVAAVYWASALTTGIGAA